jgi:tellurite resistance protein TerC
MHLTPDTWTFLVFGCALVVALLLDLGFLSKANAPVTIAKALTQTLLWVVLALSFGGFLMAEKGPVLAAQYLSAYLMEWSLSIDNIFVFILLFTYFQVKQAKIGRILLAGVLMAIVFRVLFIAGGLALVSAAHWVLYLFGAFLLYTGISLFRAKENATFDARENRVYRFLKRTLRLSDEGPAIVIILLATTDIVFALDSIPAVLAISSVPLVVYTSNIFAVLGLRSLFFLLRGAINRFRYLQQGIAVVLVFIGAKMLADIWSIRLPEWVSLAVIAGCLGGSILFSLYRSSTLKNNV